MTVLRRIGENLAASLRALVQPARIPPERRTPLWPVKGWITVVALLAILLVVAASMLLLGTGLAGIGAAARRRRLARKGD